MSKKAKNKVINGSFEGQKIMNLKGVLCVLGKSIKKEDRVIFNNDFVQEINLITEEHSSLGKSGAKRAVVGGLLLGPIGLAAGLTAKQKNVYNLKVTWVDETLEASIIEVDKKLYDKLLLIFA